MKAAKHEIVILPARRCRRSKKIMNYLHEHGIPFQRIDVELPEGQVLVKKYNIKASPGILVDGVSYTPFDILVASKCRINEEAAAKIFHI